MERINRDAYEVSGTDLEGFKEAVKKCLQLLTVGE